MPENAPYLMSEMTGEQYLDAISCPRINPIEQGKRVVDSSRGIRASSSNAMSTAGGTHGSEIDDEDLSDNEDYVPRNVSLLDETLAKNSSKPSPEGGVMRFVDDFGGMRRYSFLDPNDEHHAYFRWRLSQNKSGNGIPPQHDYRTHV